MRIVPVTRIRAAIAANRPRNAIAENQKKFGLLLGILGLLESLVVTGILIFRDHALTDVLTQRRILGFLATALVFYIPRKWNRPSVRFFQMMFLITGIAYSYRSPRDLYYSLGLLTVLIYMAACYGYLDKLGRWILPLRVASILGFFTTAIIQAPLWTRDDAFVTTIFIVFYVAFLVVFNYEDLAKVALRNFELHETIQILESEKNRLTREVEDLQDAMTNSSDGVEESQVRSEHRLDEILKNFKLTPTEKKIVREVYRTGESNQEVASILGMKIGTVKQHLTRVYSKLDVKNRGQMITMVRYSLNRTKTSDSG